LLRSLPSWFTQEVYCTLLAQVVLISFRVVHP
jgi:hypothetical protein